MNVSTLQTASRNPAAPGESSAGVSGWLTSLRARQLVWAFLWLGLLARAIRYLLKFPLWDDETFLCVNFVDAGYADLLQPLEYHQVAPLLFLWLELSCVKLLGYSEWALRLPALAASIGSLFLFRHLANRLLAGWPRVAAMAVFAVSYGCIRYAAEAKPYGIDLFVSLLLITLAVEFQHRTDQTRWLWLAAIFAPLAIGLSFPAAFAGGAVSLFVAAVCWSPGNRRGWPAWLAFNLLLCGAFVGFYALSARAQGAAEAEFMQGCWDPYFPPWSQPWQLPRWLLEAHTSNMFSFPLGGSRGASALTAIAMGVGLFLTWRAGRRPLLLLCLAPFALHLLAAALGRYPYGGHVKFAMYAAPLICLLTGLGAAALLSAARRAETALRCQQALLAVLALIAVGSIARDFAVPYKTPSDQRARDFARWFWFNVEQEGEAVCLKTDWGIDFDPADWNNLSWAAMFRCNRAIYSPRFSRGELPRLEAISAAWPLRCVDYRPGQRAADETARQQWLHSMSHSYDLLSHESFPLYVYGKSDRVLATSDRIDVYKFAPKAHPEMASPVGENIKK